MVLSDGDQVPVPNGVPRQSWSTAAAVVASALAILLVAAIARLQRRP